MEKILHAFQDSYMVWYSLIQQIEFYYKQLSILQIKRSKRKYQKSIPSFYQSGCNSVISLALWGK